MQIFSYSTEIFRRFSTSFWAPSSYLSYVCFKCFKVLKIQRKQVFEKYKFWFSNFYIFQSQLFSKELHFQNLCFLISLSFHFKIYLLGSYIVRFLWCLGSLSIVTFLFGFVHLLYALSLCRDIALCNWLCAHLLRRGCFLCGVPKWR